MGWLKCLSLLGCALVLVNPSCYGAVWTEEDEARALQQGQGRVSHATPGSSLNTPDVQEEGRAREQGRDDVRGRLQSQGRFTQGSRDFGPQLVKLRPKEESISQFDRLRQYGEGRGLQYGEGRGLQYGEGRGLQYGEGRGLQYGEGRGLQGNAGRLQSLQTPYTQYQGRFPQNGAQFQKNEGRYPQNEGRYEGRYPQNEGRYPQNEGRYPQKARYSQNEGRYPQNEGRYPEYTNRQQGGSAAEFSHYDGRTQDVEAETRYEDPLGGYETRYEDGLTQDVPSEAAEAQPDGRAQEPNVNPSKIQLDENVKNTDTAGERRISFDFLEKAVQKTPEKECLTCNFLDEKKRAEQQAEASKSETGYLQDTFNFVSGLFQGEKPAPARQEYFPRNPSFDSEEEYLKYRLQQLQNPREAGQNQPIDAPARQEYFPRNPEPINPKFGTPGFNGRTFERNQDSLRPSSNYGQTLDGRQEALNDGRQTDVNEDGSINSFASEEEYLKYRLQQLQNPSESTGYREAGQNQPFSGNERFGSQRDRTEPVQEDAKLDYLEYLRQKNNLAQNDQINLDNGRFGQNDRPNSRFGEQSQGGRISDAQSEYLKYRQEQFYEDPRQNVQPNLNEKSRFGEQNKDGRSKGDAQSEYLKYRQEQLYDNPVQDVQSNQVEEPRFENTRFGDLDQGILDIYHPQGAQQLDYLPYRRTGDGSKPAGFGDSGGLVEDYPSTGFESPQAVDFGQESRHFDNFRRNLAFEAQMIEAKQALEAAEARRQAALEAEDAKMQAAKQAFDNFRQNSFEASPQNFRQDSYEAPPQKTEAELAFEARRKEAELAFQVAEARRQAALEAEEAKLQAAKDAFEAEINRLRRQGCSSCHLVLEDSALHEGNAELLDLEKKQKKPVKVSKLMDLEDESVEAPRSVKSPRDGCVTCHLIQPPTPQPAPILEGAERAGHLKVPILVEVDNAGKTTPLQKRDPSGALDLRKAASFRASTFMETKEDRPFIPRPGPAPSRRGSSGSDSRRGSSGNERPLNVNAAQRRLRPKAVRPKVRGCRSCHVLE